MTEKTFIQLHQRQKESGLSIKEFCSNEAIAPSTYYNWQKKLRDRNRLPEFIPVVVNSDPRQSHNSLTAQPSEGAFHVEIEYANKTVLRLKSELDISVIKALIHLTD